MTKIAFDRLCVWGGVTVMFLIACSKDIFSGSLQVDLLNGRHINLYLYYFYQLYIKVMSQTF